MLNVVMLNVVMPSDILLNVNMLNDVMLSFEAPVGHLLTRNDMPNYYTSIN
jgi:hypothetical protein